MITRTIDGFSNTRTAFSRVVVLESAASDTTNVAFNIIEIVKLSNELQE